MVSDFQRARGWAVAVLACLTLHAGESGLEEQFAEPPLNATRPSVSLTLDAEGPGGEWLSRQLERVRDIGAGGVLLTVPVATEAVWEALAQIAARAKHLGLDVGLRDFYVSQDERDTVPRARRLVWTSGVVSNQAVFATNAVPLVFRPGGAYQEFACLAVPERGGEIQPHQIADQSQGSVPTGGVWRVYRFGLADVEPQQVDGYERTALFRHVNKWLFATQSRLKQNYGSTVLWYQVPGPPCDELVWPRDLPAEFLKRSGLGLVRHLPALAGVAVGGDATAAYVRQQVAQTVRELWRERFGKNVNELVHEAGLEAGIRIDQVPVDPEEAALYFRRPTLLPARTEAQRDANVRAAGGARTMGRRYVVGQLDLRSVSPTPAAALLPFPWKHEVDRLLSDGATRLLLETGGGVPSDDAVFRQLRECCRYAHRCQLMLQQGAPVADLLVWSSRPPPLLEAYSCDFANGPLLESAAVKGGAIQFDSERSYGILAVTAEVVRDPRVERAVRQIAARGVSVLLVASGAADEEAVFARMLEGGGQNIRAVRAGNAEGMPAADFQWRTEVAEMRVRFLHRRSSGHEVYFVVNDSPSAGPVTCTFRDTGKGVPTRWDPVSGEAALVEQDVLRGADGRVTASLFMAPHDACFIVFEH